MNEGLSTEARKESPQATELKVKVLYIAGYGRSGTTILDHVLGEIPGITTAGELRYAWDRGLQGNWFCACGRRFRNCGFWRDVFDCAFGGMDAINPAPILRHRDLWRRIPYRALSAFQTSRSYAASDRGYIETLAKLYSAVQEVSGCRILVDSSKWPDYCEALKRVPSIEVYSLHMVRDPRAVARSWMKPKKFEPDESSRIYTPRHTPLRTSIEWILWNRAVASQCVKDPERNRLLRYEDFVDAPASQLRGILAMLGEACIDSLPIDNDNTVYLHGSHALSGNPVRFRRGRIRITPDNAWEESMSGLAKLLINAVTWPWQLRYGYR